MFFFQGVPAQPFIQPTSFPGIYSEDDFVNHMAQHAPPDYAFVGRQRGHHHYGHHPRHHRRHPGGFHRGPFAPRSLENLWYDLGPACAARHPPFFPPNRRGPAHSPEQFAYSFWQQDGNQHAHDRIEAIARQRELARREREAQHQRALEEAAARREEARAAREEQIRAACAARTQARQARDEELLLALLGQLGLAVAPAQSAPVAPEVNTQQPFFQSTRSVAATAAPTSAPSPVPADRKGKGKAVDVPVEVIMPTPASVTPETPTLQEELEARIRSETDPDVQQSLVLLYSDIFDVREPAQPVAGPSGHKHVSFQVPISGPSSSSASAPQVPVSVQAEEPIDTTADAPSSAITNLGEGHDEASLHPPSPLPSLAQIKDVEDALRKLEGAFEFPAQLDLIDPLPSRSPSPSSAHSDVGSESESTSTSLAYTANNRPVRAYEHALNELLTKLDAVESNGDAEVRGRRKEVVQEVERALEAMDRRIEESRERTRRGSVSSQVSDDASVTVTPYNVHSFDNVDEVEVAVAAEETQIEVANEAVEAPADVEEPETTSVLAEGTTPQVEVLEYVPAAPKANPETNAAPSRIDLVGPKSLQLAVGIPNRDVETNASSPSSSLDQTMHVSPSLPANDAEGLGGVFDVLSSYDATAPQVIFPAVEAPAAPFHDFAAEVAEQENAAAARPDDQQQSEDMTALLPEPQSAPEPAKNSANASPPTLPAVVVPEAVARIDSSATDATFITDSDSVLSAADGAFFFTPDTATPSEPEATQSPAPTGTPTPDSPASTSSADEETFLLSSTPLADEHQPKRRRPSTSAEDDHNDLDELEIISKDELEAARNDSDWSDVESEADLEVV